MKKSRMGCLTASGIISAVLMLLIIGGAAFARGGLMFSPGKLNAKKGETVLGGVQSHAEIAGQCSACHASPFSQTTMADLCVACHTEVADQLNNPRSLHGALMATDAQLPCRACHTEHKGPNSVLTVLDPARFPHSSVGFSLNAHPKLADGTSFSCSDCHGQDITVFNLDTCQNCHSNYDAVFTQAHVETFGQDCLACHDGVESVGKKFDHNAQAFALHGKHAPLVCSDCHQGARSLSDLQNTSQDCFACHEKDDQHNGEFGTDCAVCHTPDGWDQAVFDHTKAAFPLDGKHADVACQDCHINNVFKGTPQSCFSCHEKDDQHDGAFGNDCAQCHIPAGWNQVTFDHSLAAFPLEGKHQDVACEKCHINNVFKDTPQDCFACHEKDDAHDGQFGQDCGVCHAPDDWKNAKFDHSLASFQLTGAHLNVECTQCHVNNVFKGTPQDCVSCHADPSFHAGAFGTDCASCHNATAWSPAQYTRSHPTIADEGGRGIHHGNTSCKTCHTPTVYQYTCLACHSNNQGGDGGGD